MMINGITFFFRLTKTTKKLLELKLKVDKNRMDNVNHSMYMSDQTDEIDKKTKQITEM